MITPTGYAEMNNRNRDLVRMVREREAELNQQRRYIQELEAESQALASPNAELLALLARMVVFYSARPIPANLDEFKDLHDELIGKAKAIIEKAKGEAE